MRLLLSIAGVATAAALAGGCGGSGSSQPSTGPDPDIAALTEYRSAVEPPKQSMRPRLTGRPILEIRLTGDQAGTSDVARYGADGSAVLIRSYGGGGFGTFTCRLTPHELAVLQRDAARLPLNRAPKVRERARPTFYTIPAASHVVQRGRYVGTFTADAIPADGRPFIRHIKGLMHGKEGGCRATYETRTH